MLATRDMQVGSIRPATRNEIPEIASLIATAFAQFSGQAATEALILSVGCNIGLRWDEGQMLVLASEGRIAGTVTYYPDAARDGFGLPQGWAGFRMLAVHPSARDRGFGRQLTDWCIRNARIQGAQTVGIHAAPFMKAACALYERTGFRRCPEYDLRASDLLGSDPALGDELVIAYRLQFRGVPIKRNDPGLRNDVAGQRVVTSSQAIGAG